MTIQDAIRSGKPFKLPRMQSYVVVEVANGKPYLFWEDNKMAVGIFEVNLILSEEWMVRDLPDNVIKLRPKKQLRPV